MRTLRFVMLALVVAGLTPIAPAAAQEKLEVRDGDTVKAVLERNVGKRVGLLMKSGPELTGTLTKVTGQAVHLVELGGREFFDAVVALDQVQGVVLRVRGR